MASATAPPDATPPRDDAIPGSYAIGVDAGQIHVWQYRVTLAVPDGEWHLVESLDAADGPQLTLEYATLTTPAADGYWVYSRSYDCALDCE